MMDVLFMLVIALLTLPGLVDFLFGAFDRFQDMEPMMTETMGLLMMTM